MRMISRWLWPSVACFLLSLPVQAVPENQFEQEFAAKILPEFWSTGESAYFTAPDGLKIHYRKFAKPGQEKALVILPGRTESTFKYAEFVHDIRDLNLAVFIIDHRGQGASGREVKGTDMQYVQDFSFYRDDLAQLVKDVVMPMGFKNITALGHSMGANIMSLFMVQHPEIFQKAIMSSPMLDISTEPFPYQWMGYAFTTVACWLGLDKSYVTGQTPFRSDEPWWGTGSKVRFKIFNDLRTQHKDEITGGVSYRYAQKALVATWDMRRDAEKLVAPILMFQAGNDDVVLTGGQDYVCQRAKQCRKIVFPEARHEIHIETDAIRNPWLQNVRDFLSQP